MLVGSGARLHGGPFRSLGAPLAAAMERSTWGHGGALRNLYTAEVRPTGFNKAGYPNGYTHPGSWSMPIKGGGMSAYRTIAGAGDITTAQLAMGRALSAALTGSGDITAANLSLIVSLTSALAGSGSLSASLSGALQMAASLAGSGDITAAMGAIIFMSAALEGAGTLDDSNLTGLASLAASIVSYGDLTPEGLRDAVWGALLESGFSAQDLLRLAAAASAGKLSGAAGTTVTIRDVSDAHDIIEATVDGDGNRSAVVLDLDQ